MRVLRKSIQNHLFIIILAFPFIARAQMAWFLRDTTTVLQKEGEPAKLAWAGGINSAQYHKMDLDGDQIEDLIVFDRTNSKINTFLAARDNQGSGYWKYAPQFESRFPQVHNWVFLADYNNDGRKDLFVSTALGVQVYTNEHNGADWKWVLVREALYTKGFSGFLNLSISGSDIPAIVDLDEDGDLDILGFDYSGTFIELHQNMSIERYGVTDSLGTLDNPVFIRNGDCWGDFAKNGAQEYILGMDCGVAQNPDSSGRVMHSGNSILVGDLNGDGKKDLIVGHISSTELGVFYNGRYGINAGFTSHQKTFPSEDPVSMQIFPAAFMADLDFDGIKDLVVSPNLPSGNAGLTDFAVSNWFYRNEGRNDSVDFRLITKGFLQQQMLDVGENAAPSFFDVDGDSDLDMIIGTGPVAGRTGMQGSVWFLENIGSGNTAVYRIRSGNYLGVKELIIGYNFKPQWADFDGNGTIDLGLGYSTARGLSYVFFPNRSQPGAAVDLQFNSMSPLPLPIAYAGDSPFFVDADHDGDLDLLLGNVQGNLSYYKNEGTPIKSLFQLQKEDFMGIGLSFEKRYVQVYVVKQTGTRA